LRGPTESDFSLHSPDVEIGRESFFLVSKALESYSNVCTVTRKTS